MTPADTMRAAVEALEASIDNFPANVCHRNAIALLRSALEQGEPHACRWFNGKCMDCGRSWGAPRDEAVLASIPPKTPVEAGKVGVALGVAAVQAPNAPKPMQGLADWLRAVAETQAKDTEQEACMRQWAREVDAASGVEGKTNG